MFTGIIQTLGELVSVTEYDQFRTHTVRISPEYLTGLSLGASIANNGCCLTVTKIDGDLVSFDLIQSTLGITNLGFARQAGTLGTQLNENAFNQAVQLQAADLARQQAADAANQQAGLQGAQLRLSGAGALGGLAAQQQALRLGGAQSVMGAGEARRALDQQQMDAIRNIGLQRLGVVQTSLGAQPANLGGTVETPMYSNPGAGLLGGALAGAKLFPGNPLGIIGGGLLGAVTGGR